MPSFRIGQGNWVQYRDLADYIGIDFHYSERGRGDTLYEEAMSNVYDDARKALQETYSRGRRYVLSEQGGDSVYYSPRMHSTL